MKAVFAGSFDPFTLGHKSILDQAAKLFDDIIIAVAADTGRSQVASIKNRTDIITASIKAMPDINCKIKISVVPFSGLLTDFLLSQKVNILIRGVRNNVDFTHEKTLSAVYLELYKDCQPVYFIAPKNKAHISASVIRELSGLGSNLSGFVEETVIPLIQKIYHKRG